MEAKIRPAKRLIVDLSSLCWTSIHQGKDDEFGYEVEEVREDGSTRKVHINSASHGYENAIDFLQLTWGATKTFPKDTILVLETGNTKGMRQRLLPEYKTKRGTQPEELYGEFNKLKEMIIEGVKSVGGRSVTRAHLEGDDIIAYLVSELEGEKVIMSQDGDLSVLMDIEGVTMFRRGQIETENPYGPFELRHIPVYKALVGDASDTIPGAKGFGEKAWLDFLGVFGDEGIDMMQDLISEGRLAELEANVDDFKPIKRILDNIPKVEASYAAGLLYPHVVENLRVPLEWDVGYVKAKSEIQDERLRKFGGSTRIVHADNFLQAYDFLKKQIKNTEYISLDLETTTPPESDEWLRENNNPKGVDVIGSTVVSMGLTFGPNQQYNLYFTLDHKEADGIKNLSKEQFETILRLIATDIPKVIHNVHFELPVLYLNFGELTDQVFINPCFDTQFAAAYVNENIPSGLKSLSKHYMDYDQVDYDTVTTKHDDEGQPYRVKMDGLTAKEALSYGSDDTIMTSALWNHFRIIMELEGTASAFFEIEEKASYVTCLAFAKGTKLSIEALRDMERADDELESKSLIALNEMLIRLGWSGTQVPVFTEEDLNTAAKIKELYQIIIGEPLDTRMRTPSKLYTFMEQQDEEDAAILGGILSSDQEMDQKLETINKWVEQKYDTTPELNTGSTKEMRNLLYRKLNLPVRWINQATEKERVDKPELAQACYKFGRIQRGSEDVELSEKEKVLIIDKAKADETAIQFALKYDMLQDGENQAGLKAILDLQSLTTRRNLFYSNYRNAKHWKTGKLHAGIRQCATVTLRHTGSKPNLQQLSKSDKGDIRRLLVSSFRKGLILSADLGGAELRLAADLSRDDNLMACFVGDNKKDMHSLTASNLLRTKWGDELVDKLMQDLGVENDYELFIELRKPEYKDLSPESIKVLRDLGKTANFASAYGGGETVIAADAIILIHEAKQLLEAKYATYPRFEEWKLEIESQLSKVGYVKTYKGIRRHLQHAMLKDSKWEVERAKRQASNAIIQSSCGEALRLAMGDLWDSRVLLEKRCNFIAPVHDELVLDVHPEDAEEVATILHRCMVQENYMEVIPFVSSLSVGTSFYDQPEIEFDDPEVFELDKVQEAIAEAIQRQLQMA